MRKANPGSETMLYFKGKQEKLRAMGMGGKSQSGQRKSGF